MSTQTQGNRGDHRPSHISLVHQVACMMGDIPSIGWRDIAWKSGRLHVTVGEGWLSEARAALWLVSATLARDAVITELQPQPDPSCSECRGDPAWRYQGAMVTTRCSTCFPRVTAP